MKKLFAGVLGISLATLLGVAEGADPAVQIKPGMIIVLGEDQKGESPWLAYAWNGKDKSPPLLFKKKSTLCGDLMHAFAVARNGQQYYLNRNMNIIVQADQAGEKEKEFFKHKTSVRDLALDNDDKVYFSEASGAADGHIYQVRPAKGDTAATAELFCDVPVRDMKPLDRARGGDWMGNFAFARDAKGGLDTNTLYLSSGNVRPAAIFRMTRKDGKWGKPERVFATETTIEGLVFTGPDEAYFVRGSDDAGGGANKVFRLTDLKKAEAVLTLPDVSKLCHVAIVPEAAGEKKQIGINLVLRP
jgi:hypothetical protein